MSILRRPAARALAAAALAAATAPAGFAEAGQRPQRDKPPAELIEVIVVEATSVYTNSDEGVTEPVAWNKASLPAPLEPEATDPQGVLEIVIDEKGYVETARLLHRQVHYRDKWWLAAAKSWRFKPATRGDQPVRYKMVFTFASATPDPL